IPECGYVARHQHQERIDRHHEQGRLVCEQEATSKHVPDAMKKIGTSNAEPILSSRAAMSFRCSLARAARTIAPATNALRTISISGCRAGTDQQYQHADRETHRQLARGSDGPLDEGGLMMAPITISRTTPGTGRRGNSAGKQAATAIPTGT